MNTIRMQKLITRNNLVVTAIKTKLRKLRGQEYKRTARFNGVTPSGGTGGNCGNITSGNIR